MTGERGPTGDHGQMGQAGDHGEVGERGAVGPRGRGFSRLQTVAIFVFVALVFIIQQYRFDVAQRGIIQNGQATAVARYEGCVRGLATLEHFNAQQETLAKIEETQTIDPQLAKARIDAYRGGEVKYDPNACGTRP